ncbi:MAG: LCP family protein, partial [Clostridia bacterium]|nr:LCP family protein [Clostridia bacterium]
YLGKDTRWLVDKSGQVWGNPAPLTFCKTEGKQIFEVNIETCRSNGHQIEELEGSSKYNVGAIFNAMSLPVDGYYYFSQDAFVDLIDNLGGVDVELEKAQTLGGIEYRDGVRTLDGAGALEYALKRDKGVAGDVQRLVRQRKVFLAVFQRLAAQNEEKLTTQSIGNVMGGGSRVFFSTNRDDTVKLIRELSAIGPAKITAQILPGEATTHESTAYYSVHRAELIKVLNTDFHLYDNKATEADIQIAELVSDGASESHKQVLSEIAITQTGLNEPAAEDTTATTTTTTKR